jgi:predicted RNA-binding protein with RPS1 domain
MKLNAQVGAVIIGKVASLQPFGGFITTKEQRIFAQQILKGLFRSSE